jgi:hypothetical protein
MQRERAFRPDHEVRGGDFFVEGPLGSDALVDGVGRPAAFGEAGTLRGVGTRNTNGVREVFGGGGLEKKGDDDDDGALAFAAPFLDMIKPALADARMEDGFELLALFGPGENDPGEFTAAEVASGIDDFRTEGGTDLLERRLAGLDKLAGEFVGVNDGKAAAREDGSGRGFTHADAAREADDNHAGKGNGKLGIVN